jgi:adenylyl-sulfate kinase
MVVYSKGFMVWFTGLSGAGKSTLASSLHRCLHERGLRSELLDGDEVRSNLSKGLTFSKEDRDINIRRIGFVARLLARNGVAVIVAAISPYADVRDEVRKQTMTEDVLFIEAYVDCPIDVLVKRDVKGLYKRALSGEISDFTGINAPYEPPDNAEIHIHTDQESSNTSLSIILEYLESNELIKNIEK